MSGNLNNRSLYLINNDSELKKIRDRQQIIASFFPNKSFSSIDFSDLFNVGFPVERVGSSNCENMIGSVEVPVGIVGPVKIPSLFEFSGKNFDKKNKRLVKRLFIPLATTEGALIASINRGCKALNLAKKFSVIVEKVGMSRALVFECKNTVAAYEFIGLMKKDRAVFIKHCESTSGHLKFLSSKFFVRGRYAYLRFSFDTGEAMGMNMVSIALSYAWEKIKKKHLLVKLVSLSSNVCTDKKDSALNRSLGRGFVVRLDTFLSPEILEKIFGVTARDVVKTHIAKNLVGSNIAGSLSQNMHVANALAAFYIATGQDPAHSVGGSEASVSFEESDFGGLYVALTVPTINVGSVGGGTWLPQQSSAAKLVSPGINITASLLATAAGVGAFAGEISGICALTNHSLASAHKKLGRNPETKKNGDKK